MHVFFYKDNRFCWDEYFTLHLIWHADKTGPPRGKAGGGGFLMFYATDKQKLRNIMRELNFPEVRFQFDFEGTKVILSR